MNDTDRHRPDPVVCGLLVVLIAVVSIVGVRLVGEARRASSVPPCEYESGGTTAVVAMATGVGAQIREALPCNWSGQESTLPGFPGTYAIYLSPLDARTRGVADAIIARDPKFPGVTFELRRGKQAYFRAEEQLVTLTASHSTRYSYFVQPDGSVTRAANACWSPFYPDSPPDWQVISRPGSATTMTICGG